MQVEIQSLNSTHNRKNFDCSVAPLNSWIEKTAGQQQEKGSAKVFVAVDTEDPSTILGFFSLSATNVDGSSVPIKKLPDTVPAILLGRFAVAAHLQGKGLGKHLLMCAFEKVAQASELVGTMVLAVKAKDEKAASFYRKYGFQSSPSDSLQLFLPVSTVRKMFNL